MAAAKKFEYKGTPCPVTWEQWQKQKPLEVTIPEVSPEPLIFEPRGFSSGKFGYSLSDKVKLVRDGKLVKFQLCVNVIAVNSEGAPKKAKKAKPAKKAEPETPAESAAEAA